MNLKELAKIFLLPKKERKKALLNLSEEFVLHAVGEFVKQVSTIHGFRVDQKSKKSQRLPRPDSKRGSQVQHHDPVSRIERPPVIIEAEIVE